MHSSYCLIVASCGFFFVFGCRISSLLVVVQQLVVILVFLESSLLFLWEEVSSSPSTLPYCLSQELSIQRMCCNIWWISLKTVSLACLPFSILWIIFLGWTFQRINIGVKVVNIFISLKRWFTKLLFKIGPVNLYYEYFMRGSCITVLLLCYTLVLKYFWYFNRRKVKLHIVLLLSWMLFPFYQYL